MAARQSQTKRSCRSARKGRCAERLAAMGLKVLPLHGITPNGKCSCAKGASCKSPGKHPVFNGGWKTGTTDKSKLREYWSEYPRANIGVATGGPSGIVVLDIDPRNGGDKSLRRLQHKYGRLPLTPTCKTGSGGRHCYFKYPKGNTIRSGRLASGIDVQSDGRLVVAPPSLHATKRRYRWFKGRKFNEIALAELPEWIVLKLAKPQRTRSETQR